MRKLHLLIASVIAVAFAQTEINAQRSRQNSDDTTFLLSGKITGQTKGSVKLLYTDKDGNYILDSSAVKKAASNFADI
jgi:hypothetical protein